MPVGGERVRFGPEGDVAVDVVVPWRYTTRARRCVIVCFVRAGFRSRGSLFFFFFFYIGVCVWGCRGDVGEWYLKRKKWMQDE